MIGTDVLLAKKLKKIGKGKLNGWGGKKEKHETITECAVREFETESGVKINPRDLILVGSVDFVTHNSDGSTTLFKVFVHRIYVWKGTFRATREMGMPKAYSTHSLPFDKLMPADRYWLPEMLRQRDIKAYVEYGPKQKSLRKVVRLVYDAN